MPSCEHRKSSVKLKLVQLVWMTEEAITFLAPTRGLPGSRRSKLVDAKSLRANPLASTVSSQAPLPEQLATDFRSDHLELLKELAMGPF